MSLNIAPLNAPEFGRVHDKDFDPCSISIDDRLITGPSQLSKICGFVAQDDDLLPLLTVRETLNFSAKFRLKDMSSKEEERVESLMQGLGLLHITDSFVGDQEHLGISGGERKMVSIGVDMIHDPPILLLHELTSGLDSSSALQVIELLASMAKARGRMSRAIELLEENIQRLGFQIPIQLNALEFAMENMLGLEASSSKFNVVQDNDSYVWSDEECNRIRQHQDNDDKDNNKRMTDFWFSLNLLEIMFPCSRFWKIIYRTKQLFLARTMQAIVGGFGLGSVYIKVRRDEEGIGE
ncbi:hypothetical protein V6N12_035493 [Hibiscus sabdariffa]|uniref:ABC transporter domain-containing protein n=1 Tax=Hibiscus sabdariffa TaxID=183260 RepID=A0ABR2ENA9_9ROSI